MLKRNYKTFQMGYLVEILSVESIAFQCLLNEVKPEGRASRGPSCVMLMTALTRQQPQLGRGH